MLLSRGGFAEMNVRRWSAAAAAAASVLLIAGASTTYAAAERGAPAPALAKSSTAVIALPPDVPLNGFAPILSSAAYSVYNSQNAYLMYKPLVFISADDGIDFSRSLAQSISVNGNDTVYTVHLNPKWHWSNGQPVTSADVVYDAELELAACQPNAKLAYGGCGIGGLPPSSPPKPVLKSVTADGPYTVVFTLSAPANPVWFEHNGLGQFLPFPKKVWDKYSNPQDELNFINSVMNEPTNPVYKVVDGPYMFQRYVQNEYWEFVPNPRYDGHKATIKHLIYQYFASDTAEFAALRQGTVNVGYLDGVTYPEHSQLHGYRFSPVYGFCFFYINGNFSPKTPGIGSTFNSLAVRQAIQMGIDQKAYIRIENAGFGVPGSSPVPPYPRFSFYNAAEMPKPLPFNPAAGKKLLERNGWKLVNGVMTKHGVQLSFPFLYTTGSVANEEFASLLKNDLAQEGIQITPRAMPFNQILATANDNSNPANANKWVMAWYGGWCYEPDYYPTGGGLFTPTGFANDGAFNDPALTKLIDATYLPGTPAQAKQRMTAYLYRAAHDLPVWYLPSLPTLAENAYYIHGVVKNYNPVQALNFPNYWTIKP
jgi:peptide/nickel transport system substrate-binding protein